MPIILFMITEGFPRERGKKEEAAVRVEPARSKFLVNVTRFWTNPRIWDFITGKNESLQWNDSLSSEICFQATGQSKVWCKRINNEYDN